MGRRGGTCSFSKFAEDGRFPRGCVLQLERWTFGLADEEGQRWPESAEQGSFLLVSFQPRNILSSYKPKEDDLLRRETPSFTQTCCLEKMKDHSSLVTSDDNAVNKLPWSNASASTETSGKKVHKSFLFGSKSPSIDNVDSKAFAQRRGVDTPARTVHTLNTLSLSGAHANENVEVLHLQGKEPGMNMELLMTLAKILGIPQPKPFTVPTYTSVEELEAELDVDEQPAFANVSTEMTGFFPSGSSSSGEEASNQLQVTSIYEIHTIPKTTVTAEPLSTEPSQSSIASYLRDEHRRRELLILKREMNVLEKDVDMYVERCQEQQTQVSLN